MPSAIGPGDRVICIDDDWWDIDGKPCPRPGPKLGGVYTVENCAVITEGAFIHVTGFVDWFELDAFRPFEGGDGRCLEETLKDLGLGREKADA